jgi:hypothetical protein
MNDVWLLHEILLVREAKGGRRLRNCSPLKELHVTDIKACTKPASAAPKSGVGLLRKV